MGLRVSRVVPPLGVAVLTAAMALIPALRDHRFYLTDDSAAQFLPSWYHLGGLLRAGEFPLLDPTLWAGGNIAAEQVKNAAPDGYTLLMGNNSILAKKIKILMAFATLTFLHIIFLS